jgi:hypothetical protein
LDQNGVKFLSNQYFKKLEETKQTDFLYFASSSYIRRFGELNEFTNADLPSKFSSPINTPGAIPPLSFSGFILPVGSSVSLVPGVNYTYRVEIYDFHGNKVELVIPIEFANSQAAIKNTIQKTPYFVKAKSESIFEKNNVSVQIPENAFYNNFYLNFDVNGDVLTLHDDSVPVHKCNTIRNQKFRTNIKR